MASQQPSLRVPSVFLQAAKQRAYVLQELFERVRSRHVVATDAHFVVDSRLVYKPGSDLSGFFYAIPRTEAAEAFEESVLYLIENPDDQDFVRWCYGWREPRTGKLMLRRLTRTQNERLKAIYKAGKIVPRTARWFRVLTEDQILDDFEQTGSDRFALSYDMAIEIARELTSDELSA